MDNTEKVTNLEYLTELAKGNDRFIEEMIEIFLEENPLEIDILEQGVRSGDFRMIRAAAHKMRSTIPFVGLDRFIEKEVEDIEQLAARHENGVPRSGSSPGDSSKAEENPDYSTLAEIGTLFLRVKVYCEKACEELQARRGKA